MVWLLLTCQAREFGASQKANHCEMWETLRSKSSVGWGSLETFIILDILSFPRITWEQGCKSGRETGMVKLLKKHFSDTFFLACFTVARGSVYSQKEKTQAKSLRTQILLLIGWVTLDVTSCGSAWMSSLSPDWPGLTNVSAELGDGLRPTGPQIDSLFCLAGCCPGHLGPLPQRVSSPRRFRPTTLCASLKVPRR